MTETPRRTASGPGGLLYFTHATSTRQGTRGREIGGGNPEVQPNRKSMRVASNMQ